MPYKRSNELCATTACRYTKVKQCYETTTYSKALLVSLSTTSATVHTAPVRVCVPTENQKFSYSVYHAACYNA